MTVVHHKPTRVWAPATWCILAAALAVPALAALVLPGAASLDELRQINVSLKERQNQARFQQSLGQLAFDPDLADKAERAEVALDAFFPRQVSELDAVEFVRSVAELNQLELTELVVGALEPTRNATESHPLGSRTTNLRGRANLNELRDFLGDLRKLGMPHSMGKLELTREGDPFTGEFVFSMRVELYQRMAELPIVLESWSQP